MSSIFSKMMALICFVSSGVAMASISSPGATSDSTNLYYQFTYSGTPNFYRAFLDTDKSSSTGYAINGIGANYLLENGNLYRYAGSNGAWGWTSVKTVPMTNANLTIRWTVAKADVGSPAGVNLIFQHDNRVTTSAVISQTVTAVVSNAIALTVAGAPNLPYNGTTTLVKVAFTGATPSKVTLARDGRAAFATWPGGTFFTLASDGKSISGNWCISASCWGYQPGSHYLTATATYVDGSTKSSTVTLNVADTITTTTTTIPVSSVTWTRCATENGTCSFAGTRQVRYGANGIFAYKTATGSIACNNTTFGDPVPGVTKYCDYSSPVLSTPTTTTLPAPTTTTTTIPVASSGPTYYVSPSGNDLNAGTVSAPWRTIQKAANSVSAGSTVILMNGTYEEPSINMTRGGTALARVTFKAQNKWQAVISSTSGCNPGIAVNASYITLQDFRMTTSSRNVTCGVYTSYNIDVWAYASVNHSKFPTPSSPTTELRGHISRGLKLDALNRAEGWKSTQDDTIIENCVANSAIEAMLGSNMIIRNNEITGQDGGGNSIFSKGGARNTRIYNNLIHNKARNGSGIVLGGGSCNLCLYDRVTGIEAYNNVAFNNIIINESGSYFNAFVFQGSKDSSFFNNVVIGGAYTMYQGGSETIHAPVENPTMKNNIFVCNGGWAAGSVAYVGSFNVDYNNFYNCSGAPSQAHPIVGNPMFVNQASDWHLQPGSPAINSGTSITMPAYGGGTIDVSHDFNGVIRTTPWDLGIYNVTP